MEKENTTIEIQIEDTRYKLQMLLLEQRDTEVKLKMELIANYNELVAAIRKWEITYCFFSPIKGTLEYLNFWRENDFISAGKRQSRIGSPMVSVILLSGDSGISSPNT